MEDYEEEIIVNEEELFRIEGQKLKEDLHRSIGALTFLNAEAQRGAGSAILISQDIILTGAHNIFDKKGKCEYSDFKFYIGANGEAEEYHQIEGFGYPPEFRQCPNSEKLPHDYAIMKLKKAIRYDRYLPLSLLCQQCLPLNNQKYLKIFGFPSAYPRDPKDPPNYVRPYKNNFLYLDEYGKRMRLYQYGLARANRISFIDTPRFKIGYRINTLGGQSGCPIVMDDSIIAVHVGGDKAQYNVGRIVDFSFITNAQKWRKQLKAAPFGLKIDSICKHNDQILQKQKYKLALASQKLLSVNLSEYPNLLKLDLSSNNLQAINLSFCLRVSQVNLRQNKFHEISLSSNKYIVDLDLSGNKFRYIDVSPCQRLTTLYLSNNSIESIDIRRNKKLRDLRLDSNWLKDIQLGLNKDLQKLDVSANSIQTIDLHANIKIQQLKLSSCKLTNIELSSNIELITLDLNSNSLTAVDLRSNSKLIYLSLWNNQIAQIDLSNQRDLQKLLLFNNCLTQIHLLNNQKIDLLQIHSNKLKRIQLAIAINEADAYNQYTFRNQDSSLCLVELRCESHVAFDIVEKWKTQYSDKKYSFKIF